MKLALSQIVLGIVSAAAAAEIAVDAADSKNAASEQARRAGLFQNKK